MKSVIEADPTKNQELLDTLKKEINTALVNVIFRSASTPFDKSIEKYILNTLEGFAVKYKLKLNKPNAIEKLDTILKDAIKEFEEKDLERFKIFLDHFNDSENKKLQTFTKNLGNPEYIKQATTKVVDVLKEAYEWPLKEETKKLEAFLRYYLDKWEERVYQLQKTLYR